jgi:hypothetical protein
MFAAVAHGIFEGAHWQMVPAYGALVLLGLTLWKGVEKHLRYQVVVAPSALLLLAASVLFSFLLPIFHLPKPTASYPVGTTILYLTDESRNEDAAPVSGLKRELKVQLWDPAERSHQPFARYREPRETGLNGATHEDYTDQPLISPLRSLSHRGDLSANRIHTIVRAYVLAFFDKTLRGEAPAVLRDHTSPYAEISFENRPINQPAMVTGINSH